MDNASQNKIKSSDLKNAKSIMKLEKIGLTGRITNAIKINLQQFEVLKNSLDEISFRFIAFLIKGFFLNLKKDYENFSRELEYFLEIYISGTKVPKEKQLKKRRKKNETQKIVSLGNLSMFSQFSEFDKLINEAFDEKKFAETLNKISKTYISYFLIFFLHFNSIVNVILEIIIKNYFFKCIISKYFTHNLIR